MKLLPFFAAAALADYNGKPTGGDRPCNFYKMTATAIFDNGFTENVDGALFDGFNKVTGTIDLVQDSCSGTVSITGTLNGLSDGEHGWHVHTLGNAQGGCGKPFTGGHWNPFGADEGPEESGKKKREVGQIGNINCSGGTCVVNDTDQLIKLHGIRNIVGRSLVVHLNKDGGAAGGSGARVACASIIWGQEWVEN